MSVSEEYLEWCVYVCECVSWGSLLENKNPMEAGTWCRHINDWKQEP